MDAEAAFNMWKCFIPHDHTYAGCIMRNDSDCLAGIFIRDFDTVLKCSGRHYEFFIDSRYLKMSLLIPPGCSSR